MEPNTEEAARPAGRLRDLTQFVEIVLATMIAAEVIRGGDISDAKEAVHRAIFAGSESAWRAGVDSLLTDSSTFSSSTGVSPEDLANLSEHIGCGLAEVIDIIQPMDARLELEEKVKKLEEKVKKLEEKVAQLEVPPARFWPSGNTT